MSDNHEALRTEMLALLKSIDWSYEYSDDHGYWSRHAEKAQRIYALARILPDGESLLNQSQKRS